MIGQKWNESTKGKSMEPNKQTVAWSGEFGDAYLKRNHVDWRRRCSTFGNVMSHTGARSILEIGCNAGWNLTAIKDVAPWASVFGIDINGNAVRRAANCGLTVAHTTASDIDSAED